MRYNCKIIDIDEEEVTIGIGNIYITGFVNCGVQKEIGEKAEVAFSLYDDLEILPYGDNKSGIERIDKTFRYSLFGTLDIANGVLKSVIDFEIDREELFDYGYLDGLQVKINVLRIDFDFK